MPAFSDHDDAAYAADVEAASPSSSMSSPSRRQQRSLAKGREFGLYANRLRHHNPSMKHEGDAPEQPHQPHQQQQPDQGYPNSNHSSSSVNTHPNSYTNEQLDPGSRSNSAAGRASKSPRSRVFYDRSPAAENFDNYDDDEEEDVESADIFTARPVQLQPLQHQQVQQQPHQPFQPRQPQQFQQPRTLSPTFAVSPISSPVSSPSLRWASLAHGNDHTSSSIDSIAQPIASTSSAATSPRSSTPKAFRTSSNNSGSRSQSPASINSRFLGLSSHPFVARSPTPDRSSPIPPSTLPWLPADSGGSLTQALRSPSPASERPSPTTSFASDGMLVGNFSRPRMASISRGSRDARPAPMGLHSQPSWPQELARGFSAASNRSGGTFSPLPHRPSNDQLHGGRHGPPPPLQASGMISPGLPRPQAAYSRTDGMGGSYGAHHNQPMPPQVNYPFHHQINHQIGRSNSHQNLYQHPYQAPHTNGSGGSAHARDPLPWIADEALRSSYRSQTTNSTAQGTLFTATGTDRSSMATKTSSRASISWYANAASGGDDSLDVDDVMDMYEKGFADSTGAEDNAKDSGDEVLTDGECAMLPPPLAAEEGREQYLVRDSAAFFRNSGLPSSLPDHAGLELVAQKAAARREEEIDADDKYNMYDRYDEKQDLQLDDELDEKQDLRLDKDDEKHYLQPDSYEKHDPEPDEYDEPEIEREKRDSAKMLEREDQIKMQSPLTVGLGVEAGESRPGSARSSLFRNATEAEDPDSRDRYGFRKQNQYISRQQYDSWNGPYTDYINRRRRKWVAYLKDSGLMTEKPNRFPPPSVKTKRFIRKGIPPEWRGAAWFYYAGGPSIVAKHPGIYDCLVRRVAAGEAKEVDIEAIERDLHRTFPDNVAFQFADGQQPGHGDNRDLDADGKPNTDPTADRSDEPKIVSKLRRVLLAFSIYNPRIGYCQSLNFLAGLLLLFVETEEQCFWLLNVITRIYLPGTHDMSLEGSKVDLSVLMTALQDSLPNVWAKIGGELDMGAGHPGQRHQAAAHEAAKHSNPLGLRMKLPMLGGRGADALAAASSADHLPPITLCMTAWFMSCFIGTLPMETTLRVWDIFFYEGSKTLFRVALAVFKLGESEIRAVNDPMEMFGVVQAFPRRLLDCNMVMEATFRRRNGFGHLSQENIEEKRREQRDVLKEARKPDTADSKADSGSIVGGGGGGSIGGVSSGGATRDTTTATTTTATTMATTATTKGTLADGQSAGRLFAGPDAHDELGQDVRRKGTTLFGRSRRERRPLAEVM
ncbi:GTPase activating protein [Grosmannia clavigera kw1407]|uniref:GTPase activating protein n=1 Tax=Grosmannia clavigera (strain kw1407 / UAMH 11150) TaxID=655863 RepID=F0XJG7_GROCL|nr:GTPase activating protein [Grosmannia clavigera kw1407]EFX02380.1 GTPase activating protein [Grosmannia clavigera kw1407]